MRRVTLADGRALAFAECGARDGVPVVVLHGAIGSPLRAGPAFGEVIDRLGIRYLMISRPGFGASDAHPGRTLLSFAQDLAQLLDAVGLGRVAVVGVSAGGPYAVGCARYMPDRLAAVATVGSPSPAHLPWAAPGMAPRTRVALRLIAAAPALTTLVGETSLGVIRRHPALLRQAMAFGAGPGDRRLLNDPARAEDALRGFLAATASGVRGLVDDYLLSTAPWGFRLADVEPEIHVWHGERDTVVPPVHAVHLAAALPESTVRFVAGVGHFFFLQRLPDILSPLAAALRGDAAPALVTTC